MQNAAKMLELCLGAHKSISFSRVDGQYRCTTSAGSRVAPDLETLLRDLAWETHDSLSYQAHKARAAADDQDRQRAALLDEIARDGLQAGDVPLPNIAPAEARETEGEALRRTDLLRDEP